jgi:hypothetical protein
MKLIIQRTDKGQISFWDNFLREWSENQGDATIFRSISRVEEVMVENGFGKEVSIQEI